MSKILLSYEKKFKKLDNLNLDDNNEIAHIEQDKLYRKFIKDIANNKIRQLKDIRKIAKLMNEHVVKHDRDRWYA